MADNPTVAICQSKIILGGRLRVILGIIDILNEVGIIPTILTGDLTFRPEQVTLDYGKPLQINYRRVPLVSRLPQEYAIVLFNSLLPLYISQYDLLINTTNSLIFLPKNKSVVTYMFFPRKRRIMSDAIDIHRPDLPLRRWSLAGLQRTMFRLIYRLSKPHPKHKIICLSEFTRSALTQEYGTPSDLPVIYPPVEIARFQNDRPRQRTGLVTVGRFAPEKRQFEQLKLAEQLPEIQFHIVGFVSNANYYDDCKLYAEEHTLTNVHLHPGASFEEMVELLQGSRFFLHTLINEPFGITTVQAIAAGCLPIVHNSGGQREIVPIPELRYQNLHEVPQILRSLEKMDEAALDALVRRLRQHIIAHFDAPSFHQSMKKILAPYVGN